MENYVKYQIETNMYDRDACLALLKLYQFNEQAKSPFIVLCIFTLSLCALPDIGFRLCLYVNPPGKDPAYFDKLKDFHGYLETAKYALFWEELYGVVFDDLPDPAFKQGSLGEYINSFYPYFDHKIREYITSQVSNTFTTINKSMIGSFLNLPPENLSDWADSHCWTVSPRNPDYYVISSEKDIKFTSKSTRADLKFRQFTKIIGYSNID